MAGLRIGATGCGNRIQESTSELLKEVFGKEYEKVQATLSSWGQLKSISPAILALILSAESKPVDWRRWPRTWATEKRVVSLLESLRDEHWEAFKVVPVDRVSKFIDEWNEYCLVPVAKMGRLYGRCMRVRKIYFRGKGFKDLFVIVYLKDKFGVGLVDLIKNFVTIVKDAKLVEPYLWRWFDAEKIQDKVVTGDNSKYKLIETDG